MIQYFVVFLSLISFVFAPFPNNEVYNEELTIMPILPLLSTEFMYVKSEYLFTFDSFRNSTTFFYHLYPAIIHQNLYKFHIQSFILTLSSTPWVIPHYGFPINGMPSGADLTVKFQPNISKIQTAILWKEFITQLGSIFSISLRKLESMSIEITRENGYRYHGNLPREELCTENISPWKKLSPCRDYEGLGVFLNVLQLLDKPYLGLRVYGSVENQELYKLELGLSAVDRIMEPKLITLENVVGATKEKITSCPLASSSKINIYQPPSQLQQYRLSASIDLKMNNISSQLPLMDIGEYTSAVECHQDERCVVDIQRYLAHFNAIEGNLLIHISNRHSQFPMAIKYEDRIPCYLKIYYHSLKLFMDDYPMDISKLTTFHFTPGVEHKRQHGFEFSIVLKPLSTISVVLYFRKPFLPLENHPSDANRGFDLPAASLSISLLQNSTDTLAKSLYNATKIFTPSLLVQLPTPDFSMPYNVIMLTSTIVAFFFGTILNTLLRRHRQSRLEKAMQQEEKIRNPPLWRRLINKRT